MRVPNVSPASDEHSCREMPLTEWREKCRRVRKEGVLYLRSYDEKTIKIKQKYTNLAVAVASAMIFALSLDTIFCFIYNV